MYAVEIIDDNGDPAEFIVASPVVALDLVLRAQRAGLHWKALDEARGRVLPLEDLRHRALTVAADDSTASEQLHRAEREHQQGCRAVLN